MVSARLVTINEFYAACFNKGEKMGNAFAVIFGLSFIFAMTVTGALLACFIPENSFGKCFPYLNGFSGGVMVAASLWSLVLPALGSAGEHAALKVALGIALGGAFIFVFAFIFPEDEKAEFNRLFVAMTAHNIPEGIAVGFALGSGILSGAGVIAGISVALGIGLQNLPEGAAITLPARKIYSKKTAFFKGVISGAVEPISGAIGFIAVGFISVLMPYLMAFAAGAMLFVVFSELNADEKNDGPKLAVGAIAGFILMMIMDVVLG